MTITLVLPALAALVISVALGRSPRQLQPAAATRLLTIAIVATSAAAMAGMMTITVIYLGQIPAVARAVGWCQAMVAHDDRIPPGLGVTVLIMLVVMGYRAAHAVRTRHRVTARSYSSSGVEIVASAQPVAFAGPGRPGHVVVSVGMIRCLAADERRVLLAHEQAHLTHHHHRFLTAGEVGAAAVPLLRPLLARLRFATERWADETAASELGGDRALVARAIARAALAARPLDLTALAFTGNGDLARVEALLEDRRPTNRIAAMHCACLVALLAASAAGSIMLLHHLAVVIAELEH